MQIEIDSLLGLVGVVCGYALVFVLLPLIAIWRIRSVYREMQQGESRRRNSMTFRFISNPKNKLMVRIVASIALLFVMVLFLSLVALVVYFAFNSGSRGWILLLIFFIPLLAGIIFAPIALILAPKLRQRVRRDYLEHNPN